MVYYTTFTFRFPTPKIQKSLSANGRGRYRHSPLLSYIVKNVKFIFQRYLSGLQTENLFYVLMFGKRIILNVADLTRPSGSRARAKGSRSSRLAGRKRGWRTLITGRTTSRSIITCTTGRQVTIVCGCNFRLDYFKNGFNL